MAIIIGSARIDENGKASGGSAGDQKQTSTPDFKGEVSQQEFYVHKKGWLILRAKSSDHANKLAQAMITACNNKNIGYDQNQRNGAVANGVASKKKTEADCSALVRACIIEATDTDPGNMTTVTMPEVLKKSGLFKPQIEYRDGIVLYTGDILVTKTKGHTVIVTKGADREIIPLTIEMIAKPTLKKKSAGGEVEKLQNNLNALAYLGKNKEPLTVDGDYGINTEYAVTSFQKDQQKKKKYSGQLDGIYGPMTYKAMKYAFGIE